MTTASRVSDSHKAFEDWKVQCGCDANSTLLDSFETAFTRGWKAALACQGPVVTVSDLEALRSKIEMEPYPSVYDEGYYDGCRDALMSAIDLTALIAKDNGHE